MSLRHFLSFSVTAALALAAPLSAQQQAPEDAGHVLLTSSALFGATPTSPRFLSGSVDMLLAEPLALAPRARESENVALMIVGGAALVVGSIVDGDAGTIIMIGGGVAGLIGLWRYLR